MIDRLRKAGRGLAGFVAAAVTVAGSSAAPAGLPRGPVSAGIGIAAHAPSPDDLTRMAQIGIHIVRTDLSWEATEKIKGQYDFSRFVQMAAAARQRGIRMMFILAYGNPIYSGRSQTTRRSAGQVQVAMRPTAPQSDDSLAAYATWAAAAAQALRPYDPILEIWNEPDIDAFWPPRADPVAYSSLASNACRAIHQSAPGTTVIGPAAAHAPTDKEPSPPLLQTVAKSPAGACFDGFSAHFYNMTGMRRNDVHMFDHMAQIFGVTNDRVVNSEWGKSVIGPVSEQDQAVYLSRSLLNAIDASSVVNIWFSWHDATEHVLPRERFFGLTRGDGSVKPAGVALQTMMQQIGASRPRCTMDGEPNVTGLLFSGAGGPVVAIWSDFGRRWAPPSGWRIGSAVGIDGQDVPTDTAGIQLSASPVYIRLSGGGDGALAGMCRDRQD